MLNKQQKKYLLNIITFSKSFISDFLPENEFGSKT